MVFIITALFLQQLPKTLYIHYYFKHADMRTASLETVTSLQELKDQLRASWIFKSYVEATWDASGHKRSFCNKPHFSKMLVLAGGLVSKVYGGLNAPLRLKLLKQM